MAAPPEVDATGETVDLCVLTGDRVLSLVPLRNWDLGDRRLQVGSTLLAVHTPIGKLLAQLERAELAFGLRSGPLRCATGPGA